MILRGRRIFRYFFLCLFITLFTITTSFPGLKSVGTENRDWVIGPEVPNASLPIYDIIEENDVVVPMRAGIKLQVSIYHPVLPDGSEPPPGILCTTGYGIDNYTFYFGPSLIDLAKCGYLI